MMREAVGGGVGVEEKDGVWVDRRRAGQEGKS